MGIYSNNIKPILQRKDILIRLIVINICVFLLLVASNIFRLFKVNVSDILLDYIAMPALPETLLSRFWTPLTYMFVHEGLLHIAFNMLLLYWFGRIFLSHFSSKNLGSLYLLGGLSGAAFFILSFNTIPLLIDMNYIPMIGASASVMAIIFAAAFYKPDQEVGLLFLGRIKIIYIALLLFVLDFIGLGTQDGYGNPVNPGGHIAHIGGALIGYIYARQYAKGKDITGWLNKIIDRLVNLFKKDPSKKMKVKYQKRESDYDYNRKKNEDMVEIDHILDKIKYSGYKSLTADEKKRLFDASNK